MLTARSSERRAAIGWTRVDRSLKFEERTASDFRLFFFNDVRRFNFYAPGESNRQRLSFSVGSGHLKVSDSVLRTFYVRCEGCLAYLVVDGRVVTSVRPGETRQVGQVDLTAGWHRRIVPARGDAQHLAHGGHRTGGPIRLHGLEPFGGIEWVCRANQAAAFLRSPAPHGASHSRAARAKVPSVPRAIGPSRRRPASESVCRTQFRMHCADGSHCGPGKLGFALGCP